jgi:hypothetical protein
MADADLQSRSAWWQPLRDHGHDWRFVVRSHPDVTPPVLWRVVAPTTVDLRESDRAVEVRLHVVDAGRGTKQVSVFRLADARTHWARVPARLVSGTRRDGWWSAGLQFARCTTNPGDPEVTAIATDRLDNASDVLPVVSLEKVVADHRGPQPAVSGFGVHDAGPAGPLEVTFDEAAYGVSAESLALSHEGVRVEGSWTCWGGEAQPVDCVTGPVLRARFLTPSSPQPATSYSLETNPEHVLDLRDALGNPAAPRTSVSWFVWP